MNTLLEALAGQAETLVNGVVALAGGLVVWRLTNWSRDRADRQTELATTLERAENLIVAVADVRTSVDINHRLWKRPLEQARFLALIAFAVTGAGVHMRVRGGSAREIFAATVGAAARLGLREIRANKTALPHCASPSGESMQRQPPSCATPMSALSRRRTNCLRPWATSRTPPGSRPRSNASSEHRLTVTDHQARQPAGRRAHNAASSASSTALGSVPAVPVALGLSAVEHELKRTA
ncbi:hypothetical protein [Streptomyces hirsutus]|uniref:hypothetical protein n=1 Tax=Streptomyces hirsutus TaxID=35620 RepID=UPI000AB84B70|nr:hypothetical protein [Streptomyces hirsutus]